MMKIIDGKRYNTATAADICYHGNNYGKSDFNCIDMRLYRTKKGAWFVSGWGGAATRYACKCGDSWGGQYTIVPISAAEAQSIMEEDGAFEEIEKHFEVEDA